MHMYTRCIARLAHNAYYLTSSNVFVFADSNTIKMAISRIIVQIIRQGMLNNNTITISTPRVLGIYNSTGSNSIYILVIYWNAGGA